MFRRLWNRLSSLWRTSPCADCGAPSVGFTTEVRGKLLTKDADGRPVTKYYLSGARPACKKCLEEFGRRSP